MWVKEPCFSGTDTIEINEKDNYEDDGSLDSTFFRGYYSISELPLFGWKKKEDGTPRKFILPKTLAKFLYCFFVKICGFPLFVGYLAARIIVMIAKPFIFKIPFILVLL